MVSARDERCNTRLTYNENCRLIWWLPPRYIGHRADRLRSNFGRPNALSLNQLKLGNEILRTDINAVTAQQRAYATSIGVSIPANANAVYQGFGGNVAQAIRPFPQYGRVTDILESEGESEYNALAT